MVSMENTNGCQTGERFKTKRTSVSLYNQRVNKEELNKLRLRPGMGARVTGKRPTLVMENLRILSFNTQDNSAFSIQKSYSFPDRK